MKLLFKLFITQPQLVFLLLYHTNIPNIYLAQYFCVYLTETLKIYIIKLKLTNKTTV